MRLDLKSPSVNPHWNVPLSIQSLIGEIVLARKNYDLWQIYLRQRIDTGPGHPHEIGIATSLIIQTSLIAERSLKTLLAQTNSTWNGANEHDLSKLFRKLSDDDQQRIQLQFNHPCFEANWLRLHEEKGDKVKDLLEIAKNNFRDWRYWMEGRPTGGGIPGPLLKVCAAAVLVCIWHLLVEQRIADLRFPINDLPFDVIGELS